VFETVTVSIVSRLIDRQLQYPLCDVEGNGQCCFLKNKTHRDVEFGWWAECRKVESNCSAFIPDDRICGVPA